jgi:hypothetical protein
MSNLPVWHPLEEIARKWSDLAERRRAHYVELQRSGRWKHYYDTEQEFTAQMRNAHRDADRWAQLAYSQQVWREAAE